MACLQEFCNFFYCNMFVINESESGGSGAFTSPLCSVIGSKNMPLVCALTQREDAQAGSGTTRTFATNPMLTVGSTPINGFLVPELYAGQYDGLLTSTSIAPQYVTRVNSSTVSTTTSSQRYLLNTPVVAKKFGQFEFEVLMPSSSNSAFYKGSASSAFVVTTTVTLHHMHPTTGVLTQLSTATQTLPFITSDTGNPQIPILVNQFATQSLVPAGNKIVADIELKILKTVAGNGGTDYLTYQTGWVRNTGAQYLETYLSLYFE